MYNAPVVSSNYIQVTRQAVSCPYCGHSKIAKWGSTKGGNQRYRCSSKECGRSFLDTGALNGYRVPAEQIGAAIGMYYRGMSYKQIGEQMADAYDMDEPDKRAIYEWVRDHSEIAADAMQDYPAHTSGKWVADEMQVKVGGENLWNWNVMDADTRYVLASHLSPNRDQMAAVAVMEKAAAAADGPPRSITTDKLRSYGPAIKKVFPQAEHIQSEGLKAEINNNMSERLQGTFRQREKTLRGLEGLESGQRYLDGWVVNYNLFKEHEGVDYQTPAEMAKVKPPFTEWADVVRNAPALQESRKGKATPSLADVADKAARPGPDTAPPTTFFIPDSTARRRPKGERESDDPDDLPFLFRPR